MTYTLLLIIKTFVRFLMAHTTHWNTHIYGGDTGHTHTHAGRPEVAVNLFSAFFPSWTVLLQGPPRSSGQLCSARGPSEVNCPSLVRDGHEFCYFACFYCWGS